jgi:hypothetical protein
MAEGTLGKPESMYVSGQTRIPATLVEYLRVLCSIKGGSVTVQRGALEDPIKASLQQTSCTSITAVMAATQETIANMDGKEGHLKNGEVVHGDPEFDGRVIIYVIKGNLTESPMPS